MKGRWWEAVLWVATIGALAYTFVSPFAGEAPSVWSHQLAHGFIMLVGGVWGLRLASRQWASGRWTGAGSQATVLIVAFGLIMVVTIAAMAPDAGDWLDLRPWLHLAMHVFLMGASGAAAYLVDRYRRGTGGLAVALMATMAVMAATGFGAI